MAVDLITFRLEDLPPLSHEINSRLIIGDYLFHPKFYGEDVLYYESQVRSPNIRMRRGRDFLTITLSLHKYFEHMNGRKGNHTDFVIEEHRKAIASLSNRLDLDLNRAKVVKMEFGVNLHVEKSPMNYISQMTAYKTTKEFRDLVKANHLFGKKAFLSKYTIKVYDKSFEIKRNQKITNVEGNILRVEVDYKARNTFNKFVTKVSDLLVRQNVVGLYQDLVKKFSLITFDEWFGLENLKPQDRQLLFAGMLPSFWELERKLDKENYLKLRAMHRYRTRLVKQAKIGTTGIDLYLLDLLKKKIDDLLA